MGLFVTEAKLRRILREELRPIIEKTNQLAMTQAELATFLANLKDQAVKARSEILARFDQLDEAIRNNPVHADVSTAAENLRVALQQVDDLVPDAPPEPPA